MTRPCNESLRPSSRMTRSCSNNFRTTNRSDGGSPIRFSDLLTMVRRELLKRADVDTLLRLPTGIFYAQGVKANVLFFDRKPAAEKPWSAEAHRRFEALDLRSAH